jgi:anhydro-N-acetylmuramic acid kinase
LRILGFMSGTSLDGIDMAILDTDGEAITGFGAAGEAPLPDDLRDLCMAAAQAARKGWPRGAPEPNAWAQIDEAMADAHFDAADAFLKAKGLAWSDLDAIGFHGWTVFHEQPTPERPGRTRQLGDAQRLARKAGVPVVFDLRSADVAAGGNGAPLAPIYHAARAAASGLPPPTAVLNIGGVANLTTISRSGEIAALDTGPGNGLIDLWAERHGRGRFDADGALARAGRVDAGRLAALMAHPYFDQKPPKSLDRHDFDLAAVEGLSAEDGAATLTAFTAQAVALALHRSGVAPAAVIVAGGGRRNLALMSELSLRTARPMVWADSLGWRGDALEAELFAYLAARSLRGLPISFPGTTGAPRPLTGGRVARP